MEQEKKSDIIVPIREPNALTSTRQEYGPLSWNPNYIPYGKNLALNISSFLQLYELMDLRMEIELGNLQKRDRSQVGINGQGNREQALTSAQEAFTPKRPTSREALVPSSGPARVNLNFIELADYLEQTLGVSKDDDTFWPLYRAVLNEELVRSLSDLIVPNVALIMKENETEKNLNLHLEILSFVFQLIAMMLVAISEVVVFMAEVMDSEAELESFLSIPLTVWLTGVFTHTLVSLGSLLGRAVAKKKGYAPNMITQYGQYIKDNFDQRNALPFFIPLEVYRKLLLPMVYLAFWKKPLIVGLESDDSNQVQFPQ